MKVTKLQVERTGTSPDDHVFDRGVQGGVPVIRENGKEVKPRTDDKYVYHQPADWPSIDTDESRGGKNRPPLVRNE